MSLSLLVFWVLASLSRAFTCHDNDSRHFWVFTSLLIFFKTWTACVLEARNKINLSTFSTQYFHITVFQRYLPCPPPPPAPGWRDASWFQWKELQELPQSFYQNAILAPGFNISLLRYCCNAITAYGVKNEYDISLVKTTCLRVSFILRHCSKATPLSCPCQTCVSCFDNLLNTR